jgi:hypothetical protein
VDPTLFAFALGLGSAVTLAGANTFVKAAKDILGARAVMALSSAILIAPAAFFVAPAQPADLDDPRPVAARALALPDRARARPVARRSLAGLPGHARIGAAADRRRRGPRAGRTPVATGDHWAS